MKEKHILRSAISTAAALSLMGSSIVVPKAADNNNAPSAPTGLLTNELSNPLNVETPQFGWIVNDSDFNEIQTAYEIIITDGITGETAWDSGKIESSEQSYIACSGALKEGYPYSWKVKTWDKQGAESPYSDKALFSTGISDENWNADWISDGTGGASAAQGKYNHFWYVCGSGALEQEKTVAKAMGYFAGCQDYNLYINGEEIGRGQSFDYASETRYQGWDITDAVKKADGTLTAGALVRTYGPGQGRAATDAAFIGHINVYYTDGTSTVITTGSDWTVSKSVPFSGTTTRNGEGDFVEKYNAENAQDDFTASDCDASSWTAATVLGTNTTSAITSITPELSKPTAYEVHPVSVTVLDDGTTVADFGTVIPARPSIIFNNGTAGKEIQIQGSYVLLPSGAVSSAKNGTQDTDMRWIYTQKEGQQIYNTWDHLAFRYLSIPVCDEKFTADMITAKVVHTNVPEGRNSTLETSNEMLNSVYEMMKRSALYSIQNSFVDTPTREKGQFLQDSINISEASTAAVFEREASRKAINQFINSMERYWKNGDGTLNGHINSVYPNGDGQRDIPDFTVNFPYWIWNYYMTTGDKATLEYAYPYVKAVADYISRYIDSDTGLVTKLDGGNNAQNAYQYGIVDWPAAGRFGYDWTNTKNGARATVNMIAKRAFDVTSNMAGILGNSEDQADMENRSSAIKNAINDKLINSNGLYCDGLDESGNQVSHVSQHANSYALAFDIAPQTNYAAMADYIAGSGMRQGPMTADILAKGMFKSGKYAEALKLFTEPEDNGWAKEIKNGYSFTFESWQADTTSDSQSHGWGATAAADMLENFAGVSNLAPGAARIKIAPVYTDLSSLKANVSTERGSAAVAYTRDELSYDIKISVPANVTAEIDLPVIGSGKFVEKNGNAGEGTIEAAYQIINVGSGSYEFTYSGEINIQPEPVEYVPETVTDNYVFTGLDSDILTAGYAGDYKYNDKLILSFSGNGSSSISSGGNGLDLYNDGSYVKFTAPEDGTIMITGKMRAKSGSNAASTLYASSTGPSDGTAIADTVSKNDSTERTIATTEVKAGTSYYLYNTAGRPTSIASISYTYVKKNNTSTEAPSAAPATPTASEIPPVTATNTPKPTIAVKPTSRPDSAFNGKYMHISFDDVYVCLKDITDNNYSSVFENSFLADLKKLHDSYGAVFTLNCFNKYSSDNSYNIANLPDRYAQELTENADWLKFAFHAEDDQTQYTTALVSGRTNGTAEQIAKSYKTFTDAIMKATGNNAASIDTVTRLGFFAGDTDCVNAIKTCDFGITGLLTADDTRVSYYFDDNLNRYILANNDYYDTNMDLRLIRSQLRLESVKSTSAMFADFESYNGNILEIFTHEQEYKNNVPNRLKTYVEWAYNNGYGFDYAMNVQGEFLKIVSKTQDGTAVSFTLQADTADDAVVIAAAYNEDGTLYAVNSAKVSDNRAEITIDVPTEKPSVKLMLWDSLETMKPLSAGLISKNDPAAKSAITLNYNNYPLVVGNKSKTDFTEWEVYGSSVTLSAAVESDTYSLSDITWTSADETIATVTKDGKVQGRTTGITKVSASLPDGDTKACEIVVIDNVTRLTVQRIEFNTDKLELVPSKSAAAIPIIYPKSVYSNGVINELLTWSSDNESVATVTDGVITAIAPGTATIAAVSQDVGRKGTLTVTVSENINTVVLDDSTSKKTIISVGDTAQLTSPSEDIIWKSDNSHIADVDENGVVTGYSVSKTPTVGSDGTVSFNENGEVEYTEDTVKIYATARNGGAVKIFEVQVTESQKTAQSVALNDTEISIAAGGTAELTAAVLPADLCKKTVTWRSDNESVAAVTDSGRTVYGLCKADVVAIAPGTATITAECDGKLAECTVTVTADEVKVSSITISGKNEIDIDEYTRFTAEVNSYANNKELAWLSSDSSIATVNNEGVIMGYAVGNAKIYALALDCVSDTAAVKTLEDTRAVSEEQIAALGSVYAEYDINVKEDSPYLRWVHAPTEGITEDSISLIWSRASALDTAELSAYEVYANGEKIERVDTEGYSLRNLLADTEYIIEIKAVDASGSVLAEQSITVNTAPKSAVINVMDYGAKGNGLVTDTYAIQKAIDACPENGTVLLPAGYTFVSGALFLKSDMTFKVDGILLGSPYDKDYPLVVTRWEGWRKLGQKSDEWANTTSDLPDNHYPHASLINAGTYDEGENSHTGPYNVKNIKICGSGQINANGFTPVIYVYYTRDIRGATPKGGSCIISIIVNSQVNIIYCCKQFSVD